MAGMGTLLTDTQPTSGDTGPTLPTTARAREKLFPKLFPIRIDAKKQLMAVCECVLFLFYLFFSLRYTHTHTPRSPPSPFGRSITEYFACANNTSSFSCCVSSTVGPNSGGDGARPIRVCRRREMVRARNIISIDSLHGHTHTHTRRHCVKREFA